MFFSSLLKGIARVTPNIAPHKFHSLLFSQVFSCTFNIVVFCAHGHNNKPRAQSISVLLTPLLVVHDIPQKSVQKISYLQFLTVNI